MYGANIILILITNFDIILIHYCLRTSFECLYLIKIYFICLLFVAFHGQVNILFWKIVAC